MSPPGSSERFKGQHPMAPILVSLAPDTMPESQMELDKGVLNSTKLYLKIQLCLNRIGPFFKKGKY